MQHFELLGPLVVKLHGQFHQLFYLLLPIFFALAIALTWFKGPAGGFEFSEAIKRAVVATLLLVGFTEMTDTVLLITKGLADRIGDLSNLDALIDMAAAKAKSYSSSPVSVLMGFNDLIIATLSFLSYVVLYVARYVTLALYHFSWVFLTLMAPFLLLFHLFSSKMTFTLFKSLIEVASWRVVWAILSAMLTALPFGEAYSAEGTYLTVVVMNFVIALCMVGTPFVVHSLVGSGFSTVAATLGPAVTGTMIALPAKAASVSQFSRGALSGFGGNAGGGAGRFSRPLSQFSGGFPNRQIHSSSKANRNPKQ